MANQIQVNDQETNQVITINDPNFYGPAIPAQDIAYSDSSCSVQIGNTNPNNVTFNYPQKPTTDYELAMWNTLDSFETTAWQAKNVGIKTGFDTVDKAFEEQIIDYTKKIAKELNIIGILNIQFIICKGALYIIEVNPRSSRTVPYISKVTNLPMIDIATRVILGEKLKNMPYGIDLYKKSEHICVKMPVFSFEKIKNADTSLGPEMKSTGEVLGVSKKFHNAVYKAFIASGVKVPNEGSILITVRDKDKDEMLELAQKFYLKGFKIYATSGTSKFLNENGIMNTKVEKIIIKENKAVLTVKSTAEVGVLDLCANDIAEMKLNFEAGAKIDKIIIKDGDSCKEIYGTAI